MSLMSKDAHRELIRTAQKRLLLRQNLCGFSASPKKVIGIRFRCTKHDRCTHSRSAHGALDPTVDPEPSLAGLPSTSAGSNEHAFAICDRRTIRSFAREKRGEKRHQPVCVIFPFTQPRDGSSALVIARVHVC